MYCPHDDFESEAEKMMSIHMLFLYKLQRWQRSFKGTFQFLSQDFKTSTGVWEHEEQGHMTSCITHMTVVLSMVFSWIIID